MEHIKRASATLLIALLTFVAAYGAMRAQVSDLREDTYELKQDRKVMLQRLSNIEGKLDFMISDGARRRR